MVAISVCVDRKAALLLGRDLPEKVTVEVTPDGIGPGLWPDLVGMLDTRRTPPALGSDTAVAEATEAAVREALERRAAVIAGQAGAAMQRIRESAAALLAAAGKAPVPAELAVPRPHPPGLGAFARFNGFSRDLPYAGCCLPQGATGEQRAEAAALAAACNAAVAASRAEIDALNREALEAQLPALRAAREAELAAATAEEERKAAAAVAANAARLASDHWQRETGSYNARRYGAPWCARITGVKGRGELAYEFADSTARHGSAGLLRVACKPGDIIARGQKDLRRADRSDHAILVMEDDGSMTEISRTEAFKRLSAAS